MPPRCGSVVLTRSTLGCRRPLVDDVGGHAMAHPAHGDGPPSRPRGSRRRAVRAVTLGSVRGDVSSVADVVVGGHRLAGGRLLRDVGERLHGVHLRQRADALGEARGGRGVRRPRDVEAGRRRCSRRRRCRVRPAATPRSSRWGPTRSRGWARRTRTRRAAPACRSVGLAWVKAAMPGTAVSTAGAPATSRAGSSGTSALGAASAGPATPMPSAAIPAATAVVRILRRAVLLIFSGSLRKTVIRK